jgi:ubiquinol-cytochrome c reductase cytochrome b subunit
MNIRQTLFKVLKAPRSYPAPLNISYFWGFGSLAGVCLLVQIVTGVILAIHYTPHVDYAFSSVEHIIRDVNYGWLLRYLHANGASIFFIVVFLHIFRGLYYGSYIKPTDLVWIIGVIILFLIIGAGFLGYILPWGQISFWGATVITSFASAIPFIGSTVVEWVWGGFAIDNATLNRFFSLHYLLPFIIGVIALIHAAALQIPHSNNPLGVKGYDTLPFHPYLTLKDLVGLFLFLLFFGSFVFFIPNSLGDPDNYIPANPLATPAHIVPEWYFLSFYSILRAIPNKLGGIIAIIGAILCLAALPLLNTSIIRSSSFRPLYKLLFWVFVADVAILEWLGAQLAESPYTEIGQVASLYYFIYIFVLVPFVGKLESILFYFSGYKNLLKEIINEKK